MKLRTLIEVEYGVHDTLKQHMDQIKLDSGPNTYRMLQTQLALGKDAWVENWLREKGYLEDPDDVGPDDKALPFHEIEALHEDEEYCPKCANKLREIVKKSIAECWKTHKQVGMKKKGGKTVPNCVPKNEEVDEGEYADRLANSGTDSDGRNTWGDKTGYSDEEMAQGKGKLKKYPDKDGRNVWGDKVDYSDEEKAKLKKEAKTKPAKGKRFAKKVKNPKTGRTRTVSYGQAGKAKKGGDRIRPGTAKGHAYCARSAKIKKCKNPPCANTLSRKKWKCQGSRSVK